MSREHDDSGEAGAPGGPLAFDLLRSGFDQAAARMGDEMTRRRLWSKVATPPPVPARRLGMWFASTALGLAGATALVVVLVDTKGPPGSTMVSVPLVGPAEVRTGAGETMRFHLAGGTRISLAGATYLSVGHDDRPVLRAGRVSLAVPKQAPGRSFEIAAGPYRVLVVGTRFHVSIDGSPDGRDSTGPRQVAVEVDEGTVEIWQGSRAVRVAAGQSWTGRLPPPVGAEAEPSETRPSLAPVPAKVGEGRLSVGRLEPVVIEDPATPPVPFPPATGAPPVFPAPLSRQVREALAAGEPERALELLAILARRSGPAAENALYESGLVLRDRLRRPRQAIEAWQSYRERFPSGLLRAEVDLSVVETLARIGAREPALTEAEAFLARHPGSERHGEIATLARALREGRAITAR